MFSPCARIFCTIPAARGSSPEGTRSQNERVRSRRTEAPGVRIVGLVLLREVELLAARGSHPQRRGRYMVGAHTVAVLA